MMKQQYSRQIYFDAIFNFRDLGGYRIKGNRTVAWRQLFRSGYLHYMTERDSRRLKEEIKLTSVIDLRGNKELQQLKEVSLLSDAGIKYFNVPFISYAREELHHHFSNMGEAYLFRIKHKEYGRRMNLLDASIEVS
jgi:protein tyrosine/serine phosphatase